jgi:hypothetical protein
MTVSKHSGPRKSRLKPVMATRLAAYPNIQLMSARRVSHSLQNNPATPPFQLLCAQFRERSKGIHHFYLLDNNNNSNKLGQRHHVFYFSESWKRNCGLNPWERIREAGCIVPRVPRLPAYAACRLQCIVRACVRACVQRLFRPFALALCLPPHQQLRSQIRSQKIATRFSQGQQDQTRSQATETTRVSTHYSCS